MLKDCRAHIAASTILVSSMFRNWRELVVVLRVQSMLNLNDMSVVMSVMSVMNG